MKFPFSTTQSLCLLGAATILGACAPYPPAPNPHPPQPPIGPEQPSTTDEATRQMEENRRRMRQQEEDRRRADRGDEDRGDVAPPRPVKKKYPTAVHVPGREGFVFNPYTNNIVDVRNIAPGKLVRDPDDADTSHKFRVPK